MLIQNISIFLLATTLRNSYENRIIPIVSTWGQEYEHLYFVMGANAADKPFLDSQCKLFEYDHRRLNSGKQPWKGKLLQYNCPVPGYSPPAKVLYTSNCTGSYFGYGPTCRCEESLRMYLYDSRFAAIDWFMFLDDDVYVRSTPLMALLDQFTPMQNKPVAIIRFGSVSLPVMVNVLF